MRNHVKQIAFVAVLALFNPFAQGRGGGGGDGSFEGWKQQMMEWLEQANAGKKSGLGPHRKEDEAPLEIDFPSFEAAAKSDAGEKDAGRKVTKMNLGTYCGAGFWGIYSVYRNYQDRSPEGKADYEKITKSIKKGACIYSQEKKAPQFKSGVFTFYVAAGRSNQDLHVDAWRLLKLKKCQGLGCP